MLYSDPLFNTIRLDGSKSTASIMEKDLSGYGDVEDDFEFGDID